MRDSIERRFGEVRAEDDGRALVGTVLRYGEVATGAPWPERFEAGAFGAVADADVILDRQHTRRQPLARTGGGGLELLDGPDALRMRAELPRTTDAEDALTLVRAGVLRGLSVKFHALRESEQSGVRVIHSAILDSIGVVDRPAYSGSVAEVRRRGNGLTGSFRYGESRTARDRGKVRKSRIRAGAFVRSVAERRREIALQMGTDPGQILGSRLAGTLDLEDTAEALTFSIAELPKTTYTADLRAQLSAGILVGVRPLYRIPPPDVVANAVVELPEPGNPGVFIEEVREATLYALSIVSRPPAGWTPDVDVRAEQRRWGKRRRLWL